MNLRWLLTVTAIFCLAGTARADYALEFTDTSGNVGSTFTINGVGNSILLQVYLVQTNTGTSNTLTTVGLSSAGLTLNFGVGLSATAVVPNSPQFPYFQTSSASPSPFNSFQGNAVVQEVAGSPAIAPTTGTNANQILLGTFRFTATNSSGGTITTSFPTSGSSSNDVNGDGTSLDSLVTQTSVTIVVAVPEPGSMALTALAGTVISIGAWRKRRSILAA